MLSECFLKVLLNLEGEAVFEQAGHLLAVVAMTITDREEMTMAEVEHVRVRKIGVLVHFVRIVCCDATLGCE